jgi:hypothetical protein
MLKYFLTNVIWRLSVPNIAVVIWKKYNLNVKFKYIYFIYSSYSDYFKYLFQIYYEG